MHVGLGNASFFGAALAVILLTHPLRAELPKQQPLYGSDFANKIRYDDGEQVRSAEVREGALSKSNRVFSHVSVPTYAIHQPDAAKINGIGLVICPGGGYRDVWLDREGHDLAIWLKQYGITSLVLKYRTNSAGKSPAGSADGANGRMYSWDEYMPEVKADAFAAIRLLRTRSKQLNLDPHMIGICGFSAGGNLAMHLALSAQEDQSGYDVSGHPDFAGLFYPWFRTDAYRKLIDSHGVCGPMFIMNALDDRVTPVDRCLEFYQALLQEKHHAELHIVSKGGHGFDLGEGRGESAALWKNSFVAWLKDLGLPVRTVWRSQAPSRVVARDDRADILADKSVQLDPKNISNDPVLTFTFDKPATIRHLRLELLPNRSTANVPLAAGHKSQAVMLFNLKPSLKWADGEYKYLEFKSCTYPPNMEAYTDAVRDYIETDWVVPKPLPGTDSVELLFEFADTLTLEPQHELTFELESGYTGHDSAGRVRFSFSDGSLAPW